ncbi:MAG: hypothetical protein IH898_13830 [Planctomycetes bacterium]|nr:hypothetical protein [Planctomycetota bacterium]
MSRIPLLCVALGAALCVVVATVGCNTSSESSSTSAGGGVPSDPVARTVYVFLDAIRTGNTEVSSSLLTPLALERITENEMSFAPPASEMARFKVGKVEMFEADKAAVDSVWTDVDADGAETNEPMTWALKLADGQWRISGLIAYMGADQPPIVVDFENPDQLFGAPQQKSATQQQPQQQGNPSPRQAKGPTQDPFR